MKALPLYCFQETKSTLLAEMLLPASIFNGPKQQTADCGDTVLMVFTSVLTKEQSTRADYFSQVQVNMHASSKTALELKHPQ